jgi:hypothetical protein
MPTATFQDSHLWKQQILEHRRVLLERLITEFPQVLKTHRTAVDTLRLKLFKGIQPHSDS